MTISGILLEEGTCGGDKPQLLIERLGHKTGCLQMTFAGSAGHRREEGEPVGLP